MQATTDKKARFVRELAVFLVASQARQSIDLQMRKPHAVEWAALRATTPLRGYPSVDEAEKVLAEFLR